MINEELQRTVIAECEAARKAREAERNFIGNLRAVACMHDGNRQAPPSILGEDTDWIIRELRDGIPR